MARYSWVYRFFVLGVGLVLPASPALADNWERFRGPHGDGVSTDKNIPVKFSAKANVSWQAPIPGDGNSSPIISGDRVFLQTSSLDGSERSLLCLDAKTGQQLWKRSIPGVKVTVRGDSSLASATPVADGEAVYIPFWNGKDIILTAYSFKGDKLWDRNFGEFVSQHGAAMSPILYKDLLIFCNDKDAFRQAMKQIGPVANPTTLYVLDKKTGKTVWETPREAVRSCYSVPVILEKTGAAPELIVTSTSAITSYDLDSGKPNWNWRWTFTSKLPLRTIASSSYVNGLLLACSGDGNGDRHMVALALNGHGKEARPDKLWENKKEFPYVPCLVTKGDHVYFVNDGGLAGCYHLKSGKRVWFERLPDAKFYASPILIDGKVYACSEQGDVYVFAAEPTAFQLLAKNSLGERIPATPAVADGRLYIRGQKHLFCIGNK